MSPLHRFTLVVIVFASLTSWANETAVSGLWLSGDGDGWIRLELTADGLVGYIDGSPNTQEGDPIRRDEKNPDPTLRGRPLESLAVLKGFEYDGENRWVNGKIYDPNSGNTYKATVTLVDNDTLKVRGYVGFSLFGRTETWTRVHD
jgi:uncharacterized protein (DUF2147 family)